MFFTKMHGAGNDFVIIDNRSGEIGEERLSALAVKLCAYHTGVGADGLMVVTDSSAADYGMIFYNSDGTSGEMCGNGARCICRYGYENALAGEVQRVETVSGIVVGRRIDERRYRVRLNDPSVIDVHRAVNVDGTQYDCAYIELGFPGLPHAVVRLDGWDAISTDKLRELGRALRWAKEFPKGANVTFVSPLPDGSFKAVTFERGVEDFTLACGTGCGSTAAALAVLGLTSGENVTVHMPGGDIDVSLDAADGRVGNICITGPTAVVFKGELFEI